MIIITKRKFKKMQTTNYMISGAGVAVGVIGTTMATVALCKNSKTNKKVKEIEEHVAIAEESASKCCRALAPIQQAMINAGAIRKE